MIENHDTKQIEQMLSYLFENFDTISALIEREKNKPKAVFGFKAGGVFNPTDTDELWGSDFKTKDDEPLGEALTEPTREKPAVDLYSTTDIIIEEPLPSTEDDSKNHREPKEAQLLTRETDNDALTNDTTDSSTSNSLLRDEVETTGPGDSPAIDEPGGDEDSNSSNETEDDERNRDGETRGLEDRREDLTEPSTKADSINPWHKHRAEKPSGFTFIEKTAQDNNQSNINHDSFYEQEYKERCEKKGWEYKTKEQRHEEAKAGAEKIRKLSRPFDDFRKLW